MRKIIPFTNVLEFETDVADITAISLEHKINNTDNIISGLFYITGEYKITNGQVSGNKFNFELPFEIALTDNYDMGSIIIDIDDFRYQVIDNNKLKVNIDLFIDGDIIDTRCTDPNMDVEPINDNNEYMVSDNNKETSLSSIDETDNDIEESVSEKKERLDLMDDIIDNKGNSDNKNDNDMNDNDMNDNDNNTNKNINIFDNIGDDTEFATYRVYRVNEGETIDNIILKFNTSKEELQKYNIIEEIKTGDKLIIPANDK